MSRMRPWKMTLPDGETDTVFYLWNCDQQYVEAAEGNPIESIGEEYTYSVLVPSTDHSNTFRVETQFLHIASVEEVRKLAVNQHVWCECDGCDWPIADEDGPAVVGPRCTCAEDDYYDERDVQPDTPSINYPVNCEGTPFGKADY